MPAVNMRFYETPPQAAPVERINEKFTLNATLIGHARLRHQKPAELLNAAETASGGDPQLLMRAGRTLKPAPGVVLFATVRSAEVASGSAAGLALYEVALGCDPADVDQPGDLKNCAGYLMRVTRTWPAEVYEIDPASVTLSIIPEGGTTRGRLRASTVPGGFKADVEGEFTATIVDLAPSGAATATDASARP